MSVLPSKPNPRTTMPTAFDGLAAMLPPRFIRRVADYHRAIEMIDRLTALPRLSKGQGDYLETLSVLVEAYERQRIEIKTADLNPVEVLGVLLTEHGLGGSDLGRLLGNRPLGNAILRGERQLSKAHIRRLAKHFNVNPGVFI